MAEQQMTTPSYPGDVPRPKRNGLRGMIPSTWIGRGVRVEYVDARGSGRETSGLYLDHCPVGIILNIRGARTILAWDRLATLELIED